MVEVLRGAFERLVRRAALELRGADRAPSLEEALAREADLCRRVLSVHAGT